LPALNSMNYVKKIPSRRKWMASITLDACVLSARVHFERKQQGLFLVMGMITP